MSLQTCFLEQLSVISLNSFDYVSAGKKNIHVEDVELEQVKNSTFYPIQTHSPVKEDFQYMMERAQEPV